MARRFNPPRRGRLLQDPRLLVGCCRNRGRAVDRATDLAVIEWDGTNLTVI